MECRRSTGVIGHRLRLSTGLERESERERERGNARLREKDSHER